MFFCAIIGIVIGTVCNYLLSALWVFQHKGLSLPDVANESPRTNSLTPRLIIIVGIIALATRLLYLGWTWTNWYVLPDDYMVLLYFDEGYAICTGYGYVRSYTENGWKELYELRARVETQDLQTIREQRNVDTTDLHPEFIHPPGLPLLIAGIRTFLGIKADVPIQLLGVFLDTVAACLLAYLVGKFFAGNVAFLAGIFYALFPPLAYASVNKYPDGILSVFILGCLVCAIEGNQYVNLKRFTWWIAAGLVLGLGCYLRPDYLFVPFAIALGLWLYSGRFLRAVSALLLIQIVSLIVLLPWAYRNYQLCGRWLFTSSSVGGTMVTGLGEFNNPWGFGRTDLDREQQAKDQGFGSAWSPEADVYFRNLFWESVKNHPLSYAQAVIKRIPFVVSPPNVFGYKSPYRKKLYITTEMKKGLSFPQIILADPKYIIAAYWDLLFMGLLGFLIFLCSAYMVVREWRSFPLIFLLLSPHLYSIGTHMLTHIEARFLLPSTFCFLIGAAYVAGRGWKRQNV